MAGLQLSISPPEKDPRTHAFFSLVRDPPGLHATSGSILSPGMGRAVFPLPHQRPGGYSDGDRDRAVVPGQVRVRVGASAAPD